MAEEEPTQQSISSVSFLFLSLTIALAVGILIIKPQWEGITQQNKQIKAKQEEVDNKKQKINDLKELKENYQKIKDKITTIATALPTSEEQAELLIQLNTMALKNGVYLLQFNAEEVKKTDTKQEDIYITTPVEVQIVGDFQTMKNFVSDIEKNLRILDITSIGIKKAPQGNIMIVTLKINTYYQNK